MSKSIWVLESDCGEWYFGLENGEMQSYVHPSFAMQFVQKRDAEEIAKVYNALDSGTYWTPIEIEGPY